MKKIVTIVLIVASSFAFAQKTATQNYSKVKQNSCTNGIGFQLVLKEVLTDSRCPEGVTCVWAGEVSAIVAVYKDSKFIEEKTMVFTKTVDAENIKWINSYLNDSKRVTNSLTIGPYPNVKKVIKPQDYYLQIGYMQYN